MNRCGVAAMRLFIGEVARGLCDFKREIGHIPQRVYMVT